MIRLFIGFLSQSAVLYLKTIIPGNRNTGTSVKQRLILLMVFPVFFIWQLINWIGLFLDEILFPGYKTIPIRSPLFILGIPRSGTTFLHRLLSRDKNFTTLTTWECLFAPSITQRTVFKLIASLERPIGSPLQKLTKLLMTTASRNLDAIHDISLDAPEEDYLLLLPVLAVLILLVPFPNERQFQNLAYFDSRVSPEQKKALLNFYNACLQRHLYAHGGDRFILSKNAAMLSWQQDLAAYYPDAKFIICTRAPDEALASQLSAIQPGIDFFNTDSRLYEELFTNTFEHYYRIILKLLSSESKQPVITIANRDLRDSLHTVINNLYESFYLPMNENFRKILIESDRASKKYKSEHSYSVSINSIRKDTLAKLNQYYNAIIVSGFSHANSTN